MLEYGRGRCPEKAYSSKISSSQYMGRETHAS